jgi:DUF4097 and DUF4098 domain-containing protein YvlB
MFVTLITGAALSVAAGQQTDTIVPVEPGARLDVQNLRGSVEIQTWGRNEVRIVADHSSRTYVEISGSRAAVRLRAKARRGAASGVDYELTVPATMDVEIAGTFTDADIEGVQGEVSVGTVHGEVAVRGAAQRVWAHSVQGDVFVEGARGRVVAETVNGAIEIQDVSGDVVAETVNGEVILEDVHSAQVEVVTTNGDIRFTGAIERKGRYSFTNHNGDIALSIPESTSATVSVSTFSGAFDTAFPVTLTDTRDGGRRVSFIMGDGAARIELQSFGGKIALQQRDRR